jgi:hypothetical protein
MDTLNYENGKVVKSHSKLGIISLISSCIVFFMSLISIFLPILFPNEYMILHENKVLFNILGVAQLLFMIGAVVFSLIDIQKNQSKKLFPVVSLVLIGILVFLTIKSLMNNNLL